MRNTLITMTLLAAASSLAVRAHSTVGDPYPRHGDVVTAHATTLLNPAAADTTVAGTVWDFSNAEIISPNLEWNYTSYTDTSFSETRPHIRRDYIVHGDTVILECTETWCQRLYCGSDGAPFSIAGKGEFDENGRRHQTDSIRGFYTSEVTAPVVGRIILPGDYTFDNAVMVSRRYTGRRHLWPANIEFDKIDSTFTWTHSEEITTWSIPGARYPIAETRIYTDSIAPGSTGISWESYICPPETQPLESADSPFAPASPANQVYASGNMNRQSMTMVPEPSQTQESDNGMWNSWSEDVSVADNGTAITISACSPASGKVGFMLCDVAGRVWNRLPSHSYSEGERIDASIPRQAEMSPGDYLLMIETPSGTSVRKILLR